MYSKLTLKQRLRVGRNYEKFIAWKLQREGWQVEPRSDYGKYDRGIDLIIKKEDRVGYVQCKGWGKRKHIHENSVDQLYGAVAFQEGPENMQKVEMYIYTATQPTFYAREHADKLNIKFFHEPFPRWRRYY